MNFAGEWNFTQSSRPRLKKKCPVTVTSWVCPPAQDASHHHDLFISIYIYLYLSINLHLPLLGGGTTQVVTHLGQWNEGHEAYLPVGEVRRWQVFVSMVVCIVLRIPLLLVCSCCFSYCFCCRYGFLICMFLLLPLLLPLVEPSPLPWKPPFPTPAWTTSKRSPCQFPGNWFIPLWALPSYGTGEIASNLLYTPPRNRNPHVGVFL